MSASGPQLTYRGRYLPVYEHRIAGSFIAVGVVKSEFVFHPAALDRRSHKVWVLLFETEQGRFCPDLIVIPGYASYGSTLMTIPNPSNGSGRYVLPSEYILLV